MANKEEKLKNLLTALDLVKQDYTCGYCSKLFQDPVTLSTCLHIICSAHFDKLTHCPNCITPLTNCTLYKDDLQSSIDSFRKLYNMFEGFRNNNISQESKGGSSGGSSKRRTINKSVTEALPKVSIRKDNVQESNSTANLPSRVKKAKTENLNSTMLSSTSSKINIGNEKKNTKGETTLHVACRLGKIDLVKERLQQGANTNTKDNAGWTPFHEVVQKGRLDLVQLLLQYNTLIDVPGHSNETPLHEAIRYNHQDIAVELVKNGANLYARNSKGETPMQLASEKMKKTLKKAEENIIQTQGLNVTLISELHLELDNDDMRVYCISASKTVHNKLRSLVKSHPNIHIEQKFTKKVTHLIADTNASNVCTSRLEVLQGIVHAIWIISVNWITKSTDNRLAPFKDHEVAGVGTKMYNGPRISRYNKYKQLPGIFNGCHFYLHNFNVKHEISEEIVLTKALLTKLINDAGGIVLRRVPNPELIPEAERLVPYHAKEGSKLYNCSHYIIFKDMYEPMYNMSHIKALPIGWLIECIEKYELCEPW